MPAIRSSGRQMIVIVNADDLGISPAVNESIFDLMERKRITSATLMANGPAFRDAIRDLARRGDCSIGVHLNLTQFEPVNGGASAHLLLDENHQLHRGNFRRWRSPSVTRAVYDEMCAQIERVIAANIPISHLDSHHHFHTLPHAWPALKAVQKRYKLRKVRISKNIYAAPDSCAPSLRAQKALHNWLLRLDSRTTDGFTDLASFYKLAQQKSLPHQRVELMVHPGHPDYEDEQCLLLSPWEQRIPFGIRLVNYAQL